MIGRSGPPDEADPLAAIVPPDELPRAHEYVRRLIEYGEPYQAEFHVRRADGSSFEAVCTGDAVPGPDGRPASLFGTIQDVSEQRRAEREAREALRQAATARAQMEAEHQARQLVQAAMLPATVPEVPGLDLAVAYLPVTTGQDVGGDWYDAFRLSDGRLAIAVGDVTGHDLRAATIMGQVRNAVRAYALLDPDPGRVLACTNELLCTLPELDLVTMLFGVYDPEDATVTWSRGGHPAPLLYRDGEITPLDRPAGWLLGAAPGGRYPVGRHRLRPGETLLWYTDGLVEHSEHDPAWYLRRLRDRAAALGAGLTAYRLVDDLTTVLIPDVGQMDDICLLAVGRSSAAAEPADRRVPGAA